MSVPTLWTFRTFNSKLSKQTSRTETRRPGGLCIPFHHTEVYRGPSLLHLSRDKFRKFLAKLKKFLANLRNHGKLFKNSVDTRSRCRYKSPIVNLTKRSRYPRIPERDPLVRASPGGPHRQRLCSLLLLPWIPICPEIEFLPSSNRKACRPSHCPHGASAGWIQS